MMNRRKTGRLKFFSRRDRYLLFSGLSPENNKKTSLRTPQGGIKQNPLRLERSPDAGVTRAVIKNVSEKSNRLIALETKYQ